MQLTIEAGGAKELKAKLLELAEAYGVVMAPPGQQLYSQQQLETAIKTSYEQGMANAKKTVNSLTVTDHLDTTPLPPEEEEVADSAPPFSPPQIAAPVAEKPKRGRGRPVEKKPELAPVVHPDPFALAAVALDEEDDAPPPEEVKAAAPLAPKLVVPGNAAKDALQLVMQKKGVNDVRAVLASFNIKRISELSEKKSAEFVKACEKAVGA